MMPRQYALPFAQAPERDGEFLLAPCNDEAWTWLARTETWPQHRVALWGPEGSGKSHLLHLWSRRLAAPLVAGLELEFDGPLPAALAIDDADLAPERALLHTLNAMAEAARPVLLAARAAPARWQTTLPDLASRLRAMAAAEILPADDVLLRQMFARLLHARQLRVPEDIQSRLLLRLPRSQAAMHRAAALLDRVTLHHSGGITAKLIDAIAADVTHALDHEDFASTSPRTGDLIYTAMT
jgi:chromosomal replication initiation ATPase DnaA